MKISKLIEKLQEIKEKEGDLTVYISGKTSFDNKTKPFEEHLISVKKWIMLNETYCNLSFPFELKIE